MKKNILRFLKIIGITVGAIVGSVILLIAGLFTLFWILDGRAHPSDEELIANLEANKAQYEKVITMFNDDRLVVVHPNWMDPKDGITAERWKEYKKIFKDLQLDAGMRRFQDTEAIWFISTAQGLATGGSSKGLMYKPSNPVPLYKSLNSCPDDLKSNVIGYKKIDQDWYVVYDWDD